MRRSPSSSAGRRVGLLVVDHLQPMLDPAQEAVGLGQSSRASARCGPAAASARSASQVPARAQLGQAAAPDQLLGLGEELDLADAAAAELDVVAGDRDRAAAAMRVDLALDRMDVLDRGEVEMLAPEERRAARAGKPSPAALSPATGRALISAARSQFWPALS